MTEEEVQELRERERRYQEKLIEVRRQLDEHSIATKTITRSMYERGVMSAKEFTRFLKEGGRLVD
jgi:hypothetical protein